MPFSELQDRLIDTHVHFYDQTHDGPGLTWQWLARDFTHPTLGDISGIKAVRYSPPELHAESRLAPIAGFIHVQAARGSVDPVQETMWLDELAAAGGVPILGVVADVRLGSPKARSILSRHQISPLVRGVRDLGLADYEQDEATEHSYAALSRYGLAFDWHGSWSNAASAIGLARRHPDIRLIVEHCGAPPLRDLSGMRAWRSAMLRLGAEPNVAIKLSGWGMWDPGWTPESLLPTLQDCIEIFGSERTLFGSNWPFGRLSSSYVDVVGAIEQLCESLTPDERANIYHRTAVRWYGLGSGGRDGGL